MLRARQKIGKYRILGRIASGPLADVYRAFDPIHKTRVALKIPKSGIHTGAEEFLHEVQVASRLKHPNILSVINASYIDDHFVIAMELGEESLADRIERRISSARALDLAGQALASLAYAHENKIIHCDIKPENFILFPGNQLKLADFGFAKISLRTLKASGSGTIDYIAPAEEIKAAYAEGEAMPIELHDGSTIVLRKVDKDYDLTSRASAFKYLRERFNAGEITTGLLYLDESRAEMHDLMGNIDTPLSQLSLDWLNPGSEELKKLQNRYR